MTRFFKFTSNIAEFLRDNLTLSEWKLWSYFATLDPFGNNYVELPPLTQILAECGISERTFYRASAKFKELELFDFQYDKAYIRNLNGSDMNGSRTVMDGSETVMGGSETVMGGNPSIYKEYIEIHTLSEEQKNENHFHFKNLKTFELANEEPVMGELMAQLTNKNKKGSEVCTNEAVQNQTFNWLPYGPWNIDGKLDPNFRDWLANKWVTDYGKDIHTQRANVLSHFKKDPANLPIRWEQYQGEYLNRFQNAQLLTSRGIAVKPEVQNTLIINQRALTAELPQEMNPIYSQVTPALPSTLLGEVLGVEPTPLVKQTVSQATEPSTLLGDKTSVELTPLVKHSSDQPEDPLSLLGVVFEPCREDDATAEPTPLVKQETLIPPSTETLPTESQEEPWDCAITEEEAWGYEIMAEEARQNREMIQGLLNSLFVPMAYGQTDPLPREQTELEALNEMLCCSALREEAIARADRSANFEYCPELDEIIMRGEWEF